jgi:predicted amidophosphoribosyltransferase
MVCLPSRLLPGRAIQSVRAAMVHLLWPWRCPLCGVTAIVTDGRQVCTTCQQAILTERLKIHCPGCGGMPLAAEPIVDLCPACKSHPKAFAAIAVVGEHKDVLRDSIVQWKFRYCPGLGILLGDLLSDAMARQPWRERIHGLVPIPQPWTRWLTRQSFPVGDLAGHVAASLGLPVWPALKARLHRRQVGLGMADRLRNVRDVFQVRRGIDLKGRRLCLIDDVTTTGATLASAARTLRRCGATEVYAATIAKAMPQS